MTMDCCKDRVDLGGALAHGLALISLLSTRHVQKTSLSEPGSCSFLFSLKRRFSHFKLYRFYRLKSFRIGDPFAILNLRIPPKVKHTIRDKANIRESTQKRYDVFLPAYGDLVVSRIWFIVRSDYC